VTRLSASDRRDCTFATSGKLPWPLFDSETRQVYQIARGESINEAPLIAAAFLGPER
jgi:hypothetical protein